MRPHESVANTYFDVPKIILGKNNDNVLSLKERHDACIFRKDNRCSIYPARPLVCRPFPFTYELKRKSDPEFTLNKEARTFCKGIGIGSENFDFSRLKNAVLTMETERERLKKKVQKWNEKVSKGKIDRPSLDALIEFLAPPIKRQSRAE
jgi:Fe-S-cluster containining protein